VFSNALGLKQNRGRSFLRKKLAFLVFGLKSGFYFLNLLLSIYCVLVILFQGRLAMKKEIEKKEEGKQKEKQIQEGVRQGTEHPPKREDTNLGGTFGKRLRGNPGPSCI